MANLYVYRTEFEPVFLPGESARLITASEDINVECVAVGALPEYYKDFGALSAATWDPDNEDTNLEMPTSEMSQLRMRILDDMQLRFKNLGPTTQWRTAKTAFYLRMFPQTSGEDFLKEYLFKASEFFVYEKDTPRFDFYSTLALSTSRVLFSGWRFKVKKTETPGKIVIWVSGWPSGKQ